MFGIGPMLPVIPAAENMQQSTRKAPKRDQRPKLLARSYELASFGRPPTTDTESIIIEPQEEYTSKSSEPAVHHHRGLSLHIDWSLDDVKDLVDQLYDGTIVDVKLSLLAFWIKEKEENYQLARGLIRELGVDQGYNLDRIPNLRVRRLLQEIHDIRPRSVPKNDFLASVADSDSSRHSRRKSLTQVFPPITTRSRVWLAVIGKNAKTASNRLNLRDPQHTSTWNSPFQTQTHPRGLSPSHSRQVITSPLIPRTDTLPLSLRVERERAVYEAARAKVPSTESSDYPPNTPDRPAPLSVRSRSSQASNAIPMPNKPMRSVSTPIRSPCKADMVPLLPVTASTVVGDDDVLSTVSVSTTTGSSRCRGDVFGNAYHQDRGRNNPFTDKLNSSDNGKYGGNKQHMHNAVDDHQPGPFQLDVSDVASESSHDTFNGLVQKRKSHTYVDEHFKEGFIGDDSFHALESYVGSDDEDERSLLESASTVSEQECQTQYEFANQTYDRTAVETDLTPRTGHHTKTRACRKSHIVSPVSTPINFHRPLPLRNYESEAIMFPTAGAQAKSGRDRSQSVTSVVASRRPATETMPQPSLPQSNWTQKGCVEEDYPDARREDSHTKISEQVEHQGLSSQYSSGASTLAAFPIPPMNNPVGELPMLISRVTSSPGNMNEATSHSVATSISHEDIYRAITTVNMASLLQRTRARGDQLQVIDWSKLSSFERAWREMNEVFISTIYGRKDVVLTDEDVEYVDCVAREVRSCHDDITSSNWIRRIFERTT